MELHISPKTGTSGPAWRENFHRAENWFTFFLLEDWREVSMPVYDYICKDCQKSFELVLTLSEHDKGNIRCPKCDSKNVEQNVAEFYAVTSKKS
jgi:putative FmdB family regulatory protein